MTVFSLGEDYDFTSEGHQSNISCSDKFTVRFWERPTDDWLMASGITDILSSCVNAPCQDVLVLDLDMPCGVGTTSLMFCSWFCHGSIRTRGCNNPCHECGVKGILNFENLVDCFYRYNFAYVSEMSHFNATVGSCLRWAQNFSRSMSGGSLFWKYSSNSARRVA